ncbi:MAG: ribonuclease III [Bacteroidales bacterium]|nr:ribonuclease III [Bacteroidales bacterium]
MALKHKSVTYYEQEHMKEARKREGSAKACHIQSTVFANNERLEFLGDAVLGAIVADILYKHYGNKQEGFLTNLRSKIVCRSSLNKLAADMGLDALIRYMGAATTAHNSFMRGNAFEAFLGAIYLDRGYSYCYRFLEERVFKYYIDLDEVAKMEKNFKSSLIEWCQKRQYEIEFLQTEQRDKDNHNVPVFHSKVLIEGIPAGTGEGYSKKESDQAAAQQALSRLKTSKELYKGIKKAGLKKAGNLS